ncbi:MAG: hypothetical protein H3C35_06845 [Bacteroidetes bacterium]|nr:hypothetical protein [Bacteroidota bacterium]
MKIEIKTTDEELAESFTKNVPKGITVKGVDIFGNWIVDKLSKSKTDKITINGKEEKPVILKSREQQ